MKIFFHTFVSEPLDIFNEKNNPDFYNWINSNLFNCK